ncbi:transposable element Tcb2 transposase [Trichonephila clavipes]|nr:transposable element Tcb2 transposase [Trichonephila clavipes]
MEKELIVANAECSAFKKAMCLIKKDLSDGYIWESRKKGANLHCIKRSVRKKSWFEKCKSANERWDIGHKFLRLSWARQHRHWTVDDWKHVAWSDKSRFQLNRTDERVRVWGQPRESMHSTCQQGTVQAGGGSVMIWGVCGWRDMGRMRLA